MPGMLLARKSLPSVDEDEIDDAGE